MSSFKQTLAEGFARYLQNTGSLISFGLLILLGLYVWTEKERDREERLLLEKRYAKLIDTKVSAEELEKVTQLATSYKEQATLAKKVALEWKNLAINRGERIKLLDTTDVIIPDFDYSQQGNDYFFQTKEGLKSFYINELRINGENSPPIGYILVHKDGKVSKKNYKFTIKLESVQLKDDLTGEIRVVTRAFFVANENGLAEKRRKDLKKWKDEKFQLDTIGGEIIVDPHEPLVSISKEKGWLILPLNVNPGLGVFGVGRGAESKFTLDTNLYGYGYSKRDLDWKILHVGMNYNDSSGLGFHITPASYRLFPDTLTNTYIGAGFFLDSNDNQGYYLGVNVGF